jgi:hypothetical protein
MTIQRLRRFATRATAGEGETDQTNPSRREQLNTDHALDQLMGNDPRGVFEHFAAAIGLDLPEPSFDDITRFENRYIDHIVEAYSGRPWPDVYGEWDEEGEDGNFRAVVFGDDDVLEVAGLKAIRDVVGVPSA